MRDYVEIGVGREARRTYDLNQISLVPTRRTRSSKDVDTSWHIDAYTFEVPFVSAPTDALATPEFVIEMGKQGGLGVINAEGLWGRHEDLEGAIARVTENFGDLSTLQELHAAPLNEELLAERIAQVRDSGVTVAVRVSPQHARELAPVVIKARADRWRAAQLEGVHRFAGYPGDCRRRGGLHHCAAPHARGRGWHHRRLRCEHQPGDRRH